MKHQDALGKEEDQAGILSDEDDDDDVKFDDDEYVSLDIEPKFTYVPDEEGQRVHDENGNWVMLDSVRSIKEEKDGDGNEGDDADEDEDERKGDDISERDGVNDGEA